MSKAETPSRVLKIAIIGGGLGGLSAALALRQQDHEITIYERRDFANEVGASLSCASNGSRFLEEWGLDIKAAKPVVLKSLVMHDWASGEVQNKYSLGDYRSKFGTDDNNFHRVDLRELMKETAIARGCRLEVWHKAVGLNVEAGEVLFENGKSVKADVVICADGIRSPMREQMGITPKITPSASCCYRCIIPTSRLSELGLNVFVGNDAIEFWGGYGINKIVMSSCSDNDVVSCYCFYPAEHNNLKEDGWNISTTPENLIATFPDLDPRLHELFAHADDIKMWRLYVHDPYPYWVRGRFALLGDAAHPMLPDQSQGACQAIEDAGALGIIFGERYDHLSVGERLRLYEQERKQRATRVQEASARARTDLSERIGWSSSTDRPGKLTIEEVCGYDMKGHVADLVAGPAAVSAH
jgi:salicylate hydroxylase